VFEYLTTQIPKLPDKQFLGYFLHGLKEEIRGKVHSLASMGEMSRAKLLQVTRAVEKEIKGRGGSRSGNGVFKTRSGRNRSDWVIVKGRENWSGGEVKSGANGARNDKQTQGEIEEWTPSEGIYSSIVQ